MRLTILAALLVAPIYALVLPGDRHFRLTIPKTNQREIAHKFVQFKDVVEEVIREGEEVWRHGKHHKKPKHPKHPKHPKGPKVPDHPPHDQIPGDGDAEKSILEVIEADEAFKITSHIISHRDVIAKALNKTDADLTFLAPVNSAFPHPRKGRKPPPEDLITQAILYHIVNGQHKSIDLYDGQLLDTGLTLASLNDRPQKIRVFEHNHHVALNWHGKIVKDDIAASNGVIQALDHILIPPPNAVHVLGHFPSVFGLLLVAAKRAGLTEALSETAGITLFAPTNRAFKKLGFEKLKFLFSNKGKETLKKVLSYHVSSELVYGPDILEAKTKSLPTLEGHNLEVVVKDSDPDHGHKHRIIEINGESHVFMTDGLASNGAIHVIDTVLCPVEDFGVDQNEDDIDFFAIVDQLLFDGELEDDKDFKFRI